MAISGDTALVGARFDGDNGWQAGSAWIFERLFSDLGVAIDIEPDRDLNTINPTGHPQRMRA